MNKWGTDTIEGVVKAADPARWEAALDLMCAAASGDQAAIFPVRKNPAPQAGEPSRLKGPLPSLLSADALDQAALAYSINVAPANSQGPRGLGGEGDQLVACHGLIPRPPPGSQWFPAAMLDADDRQWCLFIRRPQERGPISSEQWSRIEKLVPALSAVAAHERAVTAAVTRVIFDLCEVNGTAVVAFDCFGDVLDVNTHARTMFEEEIRISNKKCLLEDPGEMETFAKFVSSLTVDAGSVEKAQPFRLPLSGRRALIVTPLRLPRLMNNPFADCRALLMFANPKKKITPSEALLQSAFNLTRTEAKLAARIATGEPIEQTSRRLGIAVGTARNHLKSIFTKVGVSRQPELISVLAALLVQCLGG